MMEKIHYRGILVKFEKERKITLVPLIKCIKIERKNYMYLNYLICFVIIV